MVDVLVVVREGDMRNELRARLRAYPYQTRLRPMATGLLCVAAVSYSDGHFPNRLGVIQVFVGCFSMLFSWRSGVFWACWGFILGLPAGKWLL